MQWLDRCIGSLSRSQQPVDVFVVDNNSVDGSANFVERSYPEAKLIRSSENLGFGKANNIGIKYASEHNYDYIYLLNQDAWIEPDTLSRLLFAHRMNPRYGILSPLQFNANGAFDRNFSLCYDAGYAKQSTAPNESLIVKTNFVMAAHWLVSRACFSTVGLFSQSFPHYGEDHNYIHRAIFHKFAIGIVPAATAIHDRAQRKDSAKLVARKRYIASIVAISNINKSANLSALYELTRLLAIAARRSDPIYVLYALRIIVDLHQIKLNREETKHPWV